MKITKDHVDGLRALLSKAGNAATTLYNIGLRTDDKKRCFEIVSEFDAAKAFGYGLLTEMQDSLVDAEALEAWKSAGSPQPREVWISAFLIGKGGAKA